LRPDGGLAAAAVLVLTVIVVDRHVPGVEVRHDVAAPASQHHCQCLAGVAVAGEVAAAKDVFNVELQLPCAASDCMLLQDNGRKAQQKGISIMYI
jgi:hypothetical protein